MQAFLDSIGASTLTDGGLSAGLIDQKEKIIDILTMKATSKPKARKVNGGTKKRTAKPATAPASSEPAML